MEVLKQKERELKKVENFFQNFHDERDEFIEIKNILKGDVFYECDFNCGINYQLKALTNSFQNQEGWSIIAQDKKGYIFRLYVDKNAKGFHLPKLFRVPQYIEKENNDLFYPLS